MISVNAVQNLKNKLGQSRLFLILLAIVFTILSAYIWNKSYLYSQNVLLSHPQWKSYKSLVEFPPAYHVEALVGRVELAGNRFKPLPAYGHQRIFSTDTQSLKSYSMDVRIQGDGYVDLLFDVEDNKFSGVRISRNELYPSLVYDSTADGKFLNSKAFDAPIDNLRINTVTLAQTAPNELTLFVNSEKVQTFKKSFTPNTRFGFLTSLSDIEIFSITTADDTGYVRTFDFNNNKDEKTFFVKNLAVITIIVFVLSLLFLVLNRFKNFPGLLFKASQIVLCLGAFWYSFDYFYYSRIAQRFSYAPFEFNSMNSSFYYLNFEKVRYSFFNQWKTFLGETPLTYDDLKHMGVHVDQLPYQFCHGNDCKFVELDKNWTAGPKDPSTKRILYIGGSFSAGAGAERNSQSFFYRNQQNISDLLKEKHTGQILESLNISESNLSIDAQTLPHLKHQIDLFQPDFLYLTIFLEEDNVIPPIEELIDYARKNKIQPIVMVPPQNSENGDLQAHVLASTLAQNLEQADTAFASDSYYFPYKIRLRHLQKHGALILNPNAVLNPLPMTQGLYWWDFTHPTPSGIKVLSEWLSPILYEEVFAEKSQVSKNL